MPRNPAPGSEQPSPRPHVTYDAPVASVDLAAHREDGTPYEVWPCVECSPWHAEVIRDASGDILVREWHAYECPLLQELLSGQK